MTGRSPEKRQFRLADGEGLPQGNLSGQSSPSRHERSLIDMMSLFGWRSFVPETIGLLILISLVRAMLFDGVAAPGSMPHPFWIPVLLMASQYGVMGGLFATLAATTWLFITGLPVQSATQDFYDYAGVVAAQPCAWFGTALILGGLRTLHIHHQTHLQERFDQTSRAAEDVADGLEKAVIEIARLERRIALDSTTLTSFIHSLATLEFSDRASLVAGMADLVCHAVGATSFAMYLDGTTRLEPVLAVEDSFRVPIAAIPELPTSVLDAIAGTAPFSDGAHWALIGIADAARPIGVLVCSRLQPSQDPTVAARRLNDVCRLLAVLLSVQSKAVICVHEDA